MKKWKIKDRLNTSRLQKQLGISPVLATILCQRNNKEIEEARQFLSPHISHLHSPFLFPEMKKAVNRIKEAIKKRERILVWGDEDVDGMTATTILFKVLGDLGGNVSYWIPMRATHGIGLSRERVDRALKNGETLIITVDCGTSDKDVVRYAKEQGVDVIVTDHHEVRYSPNSFAFLNPKGTSYPFKQLAGVGVSLKLALGLTDAILGIKTGEFFRIRKDLLPLVLLGTVTDRVPLSGENRILVKICLEAFPNDNQPFIQAMREVIGVTEPVVEELFERVTPVLSAGRGMQTENPLMRFFLSDYVDVAREILGGLLNAQHVFEEEFEVVYRECVRRIGEDGIIVLDDIPFQFLGSCASRLVKETGRPAILIGHKSGDVYVGEARAPSDFNLVEFLAQNEELFIGFGGHKPAAGFSIKEESIESFKRNVAMVEYKKEIGKDNVLEIDVVVNVNELSFALFEELMLLSPFGEGNPKPILATMDVKLQRDSNGYRLMGIPITGRGGIAVDEKVDIAYSIDDRGVLKIEDCHQAGRFYGRL